MLKNKSLKVLFIVPPSVGKYAKATSPHIGIAYLASAIRRSGYRPFVFDMRIDPVFKNLAKAIPKFGPDMLALTLMSMEYIPTYDLIKKIRKNFKIPLVLGGPHPSIFKEKVLEQTPADYAIYGEAELTLNELLEGKKKNSIKGLIWRKGNKIITNPARPFIEDLDSLPFPAYDLFDLKKYLKGDVIRIVSSRGCPYNCIYCSIKFTMGKNFRARSAENVVEEITYWYKKGFRKFQFTDDNFTFDIKRAEKIADLIQENKLKIKWDLRNGIRVDKVNPSLLKKFKMSGCTFIAYGVESANQDVLNAMKKGIKVEQVENALKWTIDAGIKTSAFFIIGLPKDNPEKFRNSLKFAKKYKLNEVRFYNLIPYPGTELYDIAQSQNWLIKKPEEYLNSIDYWGADPVMETPYFTRQQRKQCYLQAEKYVMELLLKNELGPFLGGIGFFFWKNPLLRKYTIKPGIFFWQFIRKVRYTSK